VAAHLQETAIVETILAGEDRFHCRLHVVVDAGRLHASVRLGEGTGREPGRTGHYVPVLAHKPGALRNGAPFKDWVLPAAIERVRRKLPGADDNNRQMVNILTAVLTDGLPAVEAACDEALAEGVHSADVILNILARRRDPITAEIGGRFPGEPRWIIKLPTEMWQEVSDRR
jgi:hypothetical protein